MEVLCRCHHKKSRAVNHTIRSPSRRIPVPCRIINRNRIHIGTITDLGRVDTASGGRCPRPSGDTGTVSSVRKVCGMGLKSPCIHVSDIISDNIHLALMRFQT